MINQDFSSIQANAISEYWQRGYIHIPGVLSADEVIDLQQECDYLLQTANFAATPGVLLRQDQTGNKVCDRLDPALELSKHFQKLSEDKRITKWLSTILQDQPLLLKDKLIFKPPGTKGYGLHQDYPYWSWLKIPAASIISVQISIDDTNSGNGSVAFYPQMHGSILPAPRSNRLDTDGSAVAGITPQVMTTKAGDLILFHSLTPHYSNTNTATVTRRVLYLVYNASQYGYQYSEYYRRRKQAMENL